jgi:Zn-finger nucleic acid-binding protein
MKCPVDGATLVMTERSGVEIDYCPQCRGVWLDRGELDKIVEKATPAVALQEPPREARRDEPRLEEYREPRREESRGDYRRRDDDDDDYRKKKRKGLLGDIFDF